MADTVTKQKSIPELRFPEFKNEWKEKKLKDLVTFSKGKGIAKKDVSNEGSLCILYGELYTQYDSIINQVVSKTNLDTSKLKRGYRNDVLIPSSGETPIDIATASSINTDEEFYIGGDINILTPSNGLNSIFLSLSINGSNKRALARYAEGKSVVHLYSNDIKNVPIKYPINISEQQKMGDFFSKLDRCIKLEEKKLELLKEQKKGYMQKIFSQKLCFKDGNGNDYPEWETKKLANLTKYSKSGGTPKTTNKNYYGGNIPFLSITDMTKQGKYIYHTEKSITYEGLKNSSAWIVPENSLIYSMYASVGLVSINKIEIATSQAMYNLILSDKVKIDYIYYYLTQIRDKEVNRLIETGTQGNLNANLVKDIIISLPSLEEQQKIGDFFQRLDQRIDLQSKKIESLKTQKQGFLQKMFV